MESKGKRKWPRDVLASILFAGSVLCVMASMVLCGGCQTMGMGRGGGLLVPGTLGSQSTELKDINGRLYDHLQILLWVGRNNYDCGGDQQENYKAEMRSYRFGNGLLGNRRLRNYDDSGSCKSGKGKPGSSQPSNGDQGKGCQPGNHNSGNREIGMKALDGCMEIVGLPDGNERILANNMDREGVERLVREAMELKARKEKLVGRMGKDVALLEKRYASYESSHRTLRALRMFGGLACAIIVVFGLIFLRLR